MVKNVKAERKGKAWQAKRATSKEKEYTVKLKLLCVGERQRERKENV